MCIGITIPEIDKSHQLTSFWGHRSEMSDLEDLRRVLRPRPQFNK